MRIKGESVAELVGFLGAAQERCIAIHSDRPTIVLPSYNGSRRIPNLTALLAMLLAERDVRVLVHGTVRDPKRVTTAEIFHDLGLTCATSAREIDDAWSRREPAFIGTAALCPPLARLIEVRQVVGLRNSGHTIAKLLAGCSGGRTLRVVNYTHPGIRHPAGRVHRRDPGRRAADARHRGRAGRRRAPAAEARHLPRRHRPARALAAGADGVVTELPVLPRSSDAPSTARWIQAIVSGAMPAPAAVTAQVDCLVRALGELDRPASRKASA